MFKLKTNPLYPAALEIVQTLIDHGFKAWFVGGVVRDMLLGKPVKDIDIVTTALPTDVERIFPRTVPIGAAFGIINVINGGENYEVATLREEREYADGRHPERVCYTTDPEIDAIRRDLTINGMFYDPVKEEIIDFVGGQEDLKRGLVRTIGDADTRFAEDYLRIMRAVRFSTRLNFELEAETYEAVKRVAHKVKELSPERVREELNKMLTGPAPDKAMRILDECGILEHILPEITVMKGVEQPALYHPEGDVFEHVMLMLSHMSLPTVELAWSILMHDVGKPATFSIDETGRERFFGHEHLGAEMAESIMRRFRFSNAEIEAVVQATNNHMRFASVQQMRKAKWRRMIADPNFALEMELHRIDCIASNGMSDNYEVMLERAGELEEVVELPKPFVTGKDLISIGLKPGPQFKDLLTEVADMQLEGIINTHEEAMAFVREKVGM